jgi:hypothetical protein
MSTISSVPAALEASVGQSRAGRAGATLERWCVAYIMWRIDQAGAIAISRTFGLLAGNRRGFEGRSGHWRVRWRNP